MNFENAQYVVSPLDGTINIRATVNGSDVFIPQDNGNTMYAEITRQVEAGTLTIQEAD